MLSMCSMSWMRCDTCVAMMGLLMIGNLSVKVGVSNDIGVAEVCVEIAVIKRGKPRINRRSFVRITISPPSVISRVRCLSKRATRRERKRP